MYDVMIDITIVFQHNKENIPCKYNIHKARDHNAQTNRALKQAQWIRMPYDLLADTANIKTDLIAWWLQDQHGSLHFMEHLAWSWRATLLSIIIYDVVNATLYSPNGSSFTCMFKTNVLILFEL